jgi:hypothetical protein
MANVQALGDPCKGVTASDSGPQQLMVRVKCSGSSSQVKTSSDQSVTEEHDDAQTLRGDESVQIDGSRGHSNAGPATPWVEVNITVPGGSTGEAYVPLAYNGSVVALSDTIYESGKVCACSACLFVESFCLFV